MKYQPIEEDFKLAKDLITHNKDSKSQEEKEKDGRKFEPKTYKIYIFLKTDTDGGWRRRRRVERERVCVRERRRRSCRIEIYKNLLLFCLMLLVVLMAFIFNSKNLIINCFLFLSDEDTF
jgi:hypothetical protein